LTQLAVQIGNLGFEVLLGREIGALRSFLHCRDDGLGLRLGEAGIAESFRDFQASGNHGTNRIIPASSGRRTISQPGRSLC
jgi:hypothetical protein